MKSCYTGNNTGDVTGSLPDPYYWWNAGAMFMKMVDYWYYTGDNLYVENQTKSEGNGDQLFWALSAMSAAEVRFPNPSSQHASWITQVQTVFDLQAPRWDTEECGSGLRWQIFSWNKGWNHKTTISNGGLSQLSARLARYTANTTHAAWATKVRPGPSSILVASTTSTAIALNDGASLAGTAAMYDHTRSAVRRARTEQLLATAPARFSTPAATMVEPACGRLRRRSAVVQGAGWR
ncbi:Glycoside hydrolase family 76 [Neofusicoccum parvum]|uniref:Glycoside hydrolase family 76 n=1 Tax=Neofusicoccum parvum TaxID=310453 RepID=A0ACB5SJE0_9PEZI|nr:Glycoside hydrolase family 76 [Neofusicoccum parvum]